MAGSEPSSDTTGACIYTVSGTTSTCDCTGNYSITITYTPPRQLLVTNPKKWTKKTRLAFAELVNRKTRTGWIVTMIIDGEITVCDPNIERRSMRDFVPLLTWRA